MSCTSVVYALVPDYLCIAIRVLFNQIMKRVKLFHSRPQCDKPLVLLPFAYESKKHKKHIRIESFNF